MHVVCCVSRITAKLRRMFRSQISDNMDRWKRRCGKSQRSEGKKKDNQRREKVRRKKMQVREKVEKLRRGSKSRLAKAAGTEPFGQMRDQKLHAVEIWKSKSEHHLMFRAILSVGMLEKCTPLWIWNCSAPWKLIC